MAAFGEAKDVDEKVNSGRGGGVLTEGHGCLENWLSGQWFAKLGFQGQIRREGEDKILQSRFRVHNHSFHHWDNVGHGAAAPVSGRIILQGPKSHLGIISFLQNNRGERGHQLLFVCGRQSQLQFLTGSLMDSVCPILLAAE